VSSRAGTFRESAHERSLEHAQVRHSPTPPRARGSRRAHDIQAVADAARQKCNRSEAHQEGARGMHSRVYNNVSTLVSPCVVMRASLDVTEARAVFPRLRPRPPLRARPCRLLWEHHGDTRCRAHFGIRLYSTIFRRSPPQFSDTTVTDACTRCARIVRQPIVYISGRAYACEGFREIGWRWTILLGAAEDRRWGSLQSH